MATEEPRVTRKKRRSSGHLAAAAGGDAAPEVLPSSTDADRSSSPGRTTRSTSGICLRQRRRSSRRRPARALRGLRALGPRLLSQRWVCTEQTYDAREPQAHLLPLDGVPDRPLARQQRHQPAARAARGPASPRRSGIDWLELLEQEPDAGLGNGGLGRLAACFLDSMATLQLPGDGLRPALRVRHLPADDPGRLAARAAGQLAAPAGSVGGRAAERAGRGQARLLVRDARGAPASSIPGCPSSLIGIPYDRPVVGYGGKTINTLRLWAAAAPDYFDFQRFSRGDFVEALAETLAAESLTRVLYPDDSTVAGQGLRFVQEYFLVACSLADLVRRFRRTQRRLERAAREGRDPAQRHAPGAGGPRADADPARRGAARLGRGLGPHAADARLHEPHAAARGAGEVAARVVRDACCRATSRSSTRSTAACSTTCARASRATRDASQRVSLIEEGADARVRMANLAIVGSHSTNGVAAIHSELLRTTTVKDLAEMFPERFNNKTNGVTPRRWLLLANPALARTITRRDRRRLDHRSRRSSRSSRRWPTTRRFRDALPQGQARGQGRGSPTGSRRLPGQSVDPDTIFDCQVKRIHEYKRQLLNALRIVVLYNRLRENPRLDDAAAHLLLRRQGGAGLSAGQADHQVHQQPRRHDRRRPGGARPAQGRVPARLLRHRSPSG